MLPTMRSLTAQRRAVPRGESHSTRLRLPLGCSALDADLIVTPLTRDDRRRSERDTIQ